MIGHALTRRALTFLSQRAARREFPALVGLFAFLVTVTLTLPVEVLVVLGALMCRQGWLRIGCSAAFGSAVAHRQDRTHALASPRRGSNAAPNPFRVEQGSGVQFRTCSPPCCPSCGSAAGLETRQGLALRRPINQ